MKLKYLLLGLFLFTFLFGLTPEEEKAENNRNLKGNATSTATIRSTVNEAKGGENPSNWNTKDWQNHMEENGLNSGVIGTAQMRTSGMSGSSISSTGNPNLMNTDTIQNDTTYSKDKALNAFTDDVLNNIVASTTSKDVTGELFEQTIKCYITRDIPIRYKCSKTKLIYGDGINNDGFKAKNECETECFEQFEAVEIKAEGSLQNYSIADLHIETPTKEELEKDVLTSDEYLNEPNENKKNDLKKEYLKKEIISTKNISDIHLLSNIKFNASINEGKHVFISLRYTDKNDNEIQVFNNFKLKVSGENMFVINQVVKSVTIGIMANEEDTKVDLKNIKLNYEGGEYICPNQQDLSNKNAGNFAYLCPSGNITTLNKSYSSYKICEDYGVIGDNLNGTFSKRSEANAVCKKMYSCSMDINYINTSMLQSFREGCIEGQTNCEEDTCKRLRAEKNPILNETVFDAGVNPKATIVNETQVQGVTRPRILLNEDLDFQQRTAEELKDEAYKNMLDKQTYKVSKFNLDEDTESSSAYSLGISGTNVYAGSAKRALLWRLKPSAFETISNEKFFTVFEIVVKRNEVAETGIKENIKDKILYLKINDNSDILKPFAKKVNWAKDIITTKPDGTKDIEHYELETSVWKYQSFNSSTNSWYTHSKDLTAEYFRNEKITLDESPFQRIKLLSDTSNMMYLFPGVLRAITKNGPYETKVYTGDFDGSGETVQKVTVYSFLKPNNESLTYKEIVEKIDNKEVLPIYDSLTFESMQQNVKDDTGEIGGNIQLYLYGKKESKTGYLRMFPNKEDVGRNGFIFIFAVDN